jgi:hypothetical protein
MRRLLRDPSAGRSAYVGLIVFAFAYLGVLGIVLAPEGTFNAPPGTAGARLTP